MVESIRRKNVEIKLGKGHWIANDVELGVCSPRLRKPGSLSVGSRAVLRSGTVLYAGSRIGGNFETGHNVVIREQNRIGNNVKIWNNAVIDYGCIIGNNVKVHCGCYVAQYTIIEDGVFLAPGVVLANDLYPGEKMSARRLRGPRLGKGAQLGVNVTVLPYVSIGAGSMIVAGAVVTRDIPPDSVVYGNPARVVASVRKSRGRWKNKMEGYLPCAK